MSQIVKWIGRSLQVLSVVVGVLAVANFAAAADVDQVKMGAAIGAGLAIGLAGLGTGLAQSGVGAAAVGAVAEDRGFLGLGILFIAIPETVIIFGFVVAFLLYGKL